MVSKGAPLTAGQRKEKRMAFAIVRTAKLKSAGNIGGLNAHMTRTMEVPNADPDLARYNSRPIGSTDLNADVQARLLEAGITKTRKGAVLAVEHLMTASPEHFNSQVKMSESGEKQLWMNTDRWEAFEKASIEWLQERYGEKNLVNVTVHKDETSPHLHAVIVPIDSKGKLNCRDFLGGRDKLRDLQTSFAEKVKPQGLERGIEGSKAQHQAVKHFYGEVKQFSQVPSLNLEFEASRIEVKAPEKAILGLGYKQDPAQLALQESERINQLLRELVQENENKAKIKLKQLYEAAQAGKVAQEAKRVLEAKITTLNNKLEALSKAQKNAGVLFKAISEGKVKPQELKQAIEQVPGAEDKNQVLIRRILQEAGIAVKQPETKQEQQRKRGGIGM
jgi:hypothetical protein